MLSTIISITTLFSMLAAGYGVGRPLVRLMMRREEQEPSSVVIWSLVIGWIVIGLALAGLGMIGQLNRAAIGIATVIGVFFGVGEVVRVVSERARENRDVPAIVRQMLRFQDHDDTPGPPRWLLVVFGVLAVVAVTASFFGALAPPTAGDALYYHLELPKRSIAAAGLVYEPYRDQSTFPLLVQMWYLWAMILNGAATLQGAIAAQLVHWMCGVMLGMAAFTLARPILGRQWSMIVASVVYITPGVTNQMTAPLNDVALAMMTTLALAAWWRFTVNREGYGWCLLAGIAAGGALGTKYIAALFAVAVAISSIGTWLHQKDRRVELLKGAALIGGVAILVGGVWYARAYQYRGNPVYPFLANSHLFSDNSLPSGIDRSYLLEKSVTPGTEPAKFLTQKDTKSPSVHLSVKNPERQDPDPRSEKQTGFQTLPQSKSPLGRSPWALLASPWHISIHPDRFGGRSHQLGIVFLAGLPGLLFTRRLRGLGTLLATAGVYFVLWFFLRQNVRFLFPILSLLAVGLVWVWIEMCRMPKLAQALGMAMFLFVFTVYAGVSVRRSWDRVPVALGLQNHRDYLLRANPHYALAQKINQKVGPGGHLLSQDFRNFYLDCAITPEPVFHRFIPYDTTSIPPGQFSRMLRRAGFSHVLLVHNLRDEGDQVDGTLLHRLRAEADIELKVLATIEDPDGGRREYLLGSLLDHNFSCY